MNKRILLFLAIAAALPLAAQDVLTIGSTAAAPGSTITVPVYLRDASGTALGMTSGVGRRIQGIMLQVAATPAVGTITFEPAGVLHGRTPLYQRSGSGRWIGAYSESAHPLPFTVGAAAPGDRIGTLRITLPAALAGTSSVTLAFNPLTTMLSNEAATVTGSLANRQIQLVNGTIALSGGNSTSTALTSTPNPSGTGGNVTFTAQVTSPAAGAIGGSVVFIENSQIIGSAVVQQGQATWTTSSLTQGTHSITATYEGDATHLASTSAPVQQVVNAGVAAPTNVVATALTSTQVAISWSASTGATQYEVRRKAAGGAYTLIGTVSTTSFTDSAVAANQTYLYTVRALATGVASGDSALDYATTVIFSEEIVGGQTRVKLLHLTQLRTAVNAFRAAAGLPAIAFTDAAPTIVRKVHVDQLRNGLLEARAALGLSPLVLTEAEQPPLVRGAHFLSLRAAVK